MADDIGRLLDEARRLEPGDRARIVVELLATLEPDLASGQRDASEWIQEIERRAAMSGSTAISWTAALAQIRRRLSDR